MIFSKMQFYQFNKEVYLLPNRNFSPAMKLNIYSHDIGSQLFMKIGTCTISGQAFFIQIEY
jgi:hypothetical protein